MPVSNRGAAQCACVPAWARARCGFGAYFAEGKLEEEIFVDSRAAEFQDLAKSLNLMSDTFKEKIDELQKMAHLQNEFIGNVSHEVRNPIFAVGGYLEALASDSLSGDKRKFYAEKGLSNVIGNVV